MRDDWRRGMEWDRVNQIWLLQVEVGMRIKMSMFWQVNKKWLNQPSCRYYPPAYGVD